MRTGGMRACRGHPMRSQRVRRSGQSHLQPLHKTDNVARTEKKNIIIIIIIINVNTNNNNNPIWGGSVVTGEEPPARSGELNHPIPASRLMSSGHHISMGHRVGRKQLNSDTNVSNNTHVKEILVRRRRRTFFSEKREKREV